MQMKHIIANTAIVMFITGIAGCMNNGKNNGATQNSIDTAKPQSNLPINGKDTPNKPDRTRMPGTTADSIGTNK